eukprot:scaffold279177_cov33-Prasinocladus_malaysianus.AAC.1
MGPAGAEVGLDVRAARLVAPELRDVPLIGPEGVEQVVAVAGDAVGSAAPLRRRTAGCELQGLPVGSSSGTQGKLATLPLHVAQIPDLDDAVRGSYARATKSHTSHIPVPENYTKTRNFSSCGI